MNIDYIKDIEKLKGRIKMSLDNKFFNLWMNRYKLGDLSRQQTRFIMKEFWNKGTVGCGKIKHLEGVEGLYFCPYTVDLFDLYFEPKFIRFVPLNATPIVSKARQEIGKTASIGYCNSSRKPVKDMCYYYIDRMVDIELTLNTNILLQNLPFVLTLTPESKVKAKDFIDKLVKHQPVIATDVDTINAINAFMTEAPYVADKLRQLYYDYESQLLTVLGIDNTITDTTQDRMLLDAVNGNNSQINIANNDINTNVENFFNDIKDTFGVEIKVESNVEQAMSLYSADTKGLQDNTNRVNNRGGQDNDN